ncbi:MAG: methyltransferase domain-containing protein [Chloroflexi bacterium]|nr:methyltransferase domain-containing protein [Chloroflexota bacterium]MCI0579942.1 methyltransferase domain-containing protein [Chloroflexota bacterium]MCI0646525.1 methyltransferase domain-containing protein [Chloroflexota bacterium]MCI0726123.1 methyltransferase domain-containing protein [Chloroflexota bacterium]
MHPYLIELLECPACHHRLDWSVQERTEQRILAAGAHCAACEASYSVRDGIGLFLTPELQRNDLWEQVDSHLVQYLRQHLEQERQLMQSPVESLNPADLFFRAMVLEERREYAQARTVAERAQVGMYTPEYLACWRSQVAYVIGQLAGADDPIVDLASGRCYLVEQLARSLARPIVGSDFSPRVLQQARRTLEFQGLYDRVSLLAFDARRTPFKSGAVQAMTTNLGLPNIQEPGNLLQELRRIVAGRLLAISQFYPEEEDANTEVIRQAGLALLLHRQNALAAFAQAGWQVEAANVCRGMARPTPTSAILDGAGIDGMPVVETTLEWCVLSGMRTPVAESNLGD